jgi:very-short-patch-repair endonuclease
MLMDLLANSKTLRSRMTDAELTLWRQLRGHRFLGLKFKRQKPMGRYIVDFVCLERFMIIEVDGGQHQQAADEDAARDRYFTERGFRVLRFWNHEVLRETEAVLERIRLTLLEGFGPFPSPLP